VSIAAAGAAHAQSAATVAGPPGAAASVAPAPSAECFPNCRSGFTCHEGQCLSLCNPACGADERCTAVGECAKEAVVAAPPPVVVAPAPAPAPVLAQEQPESRTLPTIEPSVLRPPGTFVFQAHVGLELFGTGHSEFSCTSTSTGECNNTANVDFEDRSQAVIAFEGLFHATRGLRLGLGYWVLPYSGIRTTGTSSNQKLHLGHEHAFNAIIEGLVPLRSSLALSLRAHAGPRMLFAGGDLETAKNDFLSACNDLSNSHCEATNGPFFGATFGTMVGIVVGDRVRWRADLAVERYSTKVADQTTVLDRSAGALTTTYTREDETRVYATRFWLLAGIEL